MNQSSGSGPVGEGHQTAWWHSPRKTPTGGTDEGPPSPWSETERIQSSRRRGNTDARGHQSSGSGTHFGRPPSCWIRWIVQNTWMLAIMMRAVTAMQIILARRGVHMVSALSGNQTATNRSALTTTVPRLSCSPESTELGGIYRLYMVYRLT